MRDFPVFTTENGVGSLVLKEIPYSGIAYITIHDSSFPTEFLEECVGFCRAVGAQKIYATGHNVIEYYPLHISVIRMSAPRNSIPDTDVCLFPVTEGTVTRWREIYNDAMKDVDNAAYMSELSGKELLSRGDGYFVHKNGELFGIGIASDDHIDCVVSTIRGKGKDVVSALASALVCERVQLDVASTNYRAIKLYESLGFIKTAEVSRWHKIFELSRKNT